MLHCLRVEIFYLFMCCVQNDCGLWADSGSLHSLFPIDDALFTFTRQKSNNYEWSGGQLRVNTSLFLW